MELNKLADRCVAVDKPSLVQKLSPDLFRAVKNILHCDWKSPKLIALSAIFFRANAGFGLKNRLVRKANGWLIL
jgi:hypothetical protein